jgi:hypothetical protein
LKSTWRAQEADLLAELARKHHPECIKRGLPQVSKLYPVYNVSPYAPTATLALMLAIACKHVDAFKPLAGDSSSEVLDCLPKTRLSDHEIVTLVKANMFLRQSGKSARQRRQILMDLERLKREIGRDRAKEVYRILSKQGASHARRRAQGHELASDSWLKKFFNDIENAEAALRAGKPNPLQMQFLGARRLLSEWAK